MNIRHFITCCMLLLISAEGMQAQSDFGMNVSVGAEKKLPKRFSLGLDAELRTRDNTSTIDRIDIGADLSWKFLPFMKAAIGYEWLYDQRPTSLTYHNDGSPNKITLSYWQPRHRLHADLQGNLKAGRWNLSLRERYQYTHRPISHNRKYDTDTDVWSNVKSKDYHVFRTRLNVSYNIRHCKFSPFANAELFNSNQGIEKTRYTIGTVYNLNKKSAFELYYRFQKVYGEDDENDENMHIIGVSYNLKF